MSFAARIFDGVVVEIVELPEDVAIEDAFHPDAGFVEGSADVVVGMRFVDGEFLPALPPDPPSEAELKAALRAYAADRRWQLEQGGAVWSGWPIHTDDRSQGKYLSELQAISLGVRVDNDPWKFADGEFRPVSNADFPQLAIAAREHVRTVFGIEAGVLAEIEAGTITTRPEIDAAFA